MRSRSCASFNSDSDERSASTTIARCIPASMATNHALGHHRRERLAGIRIVGLHGRGLRLGRGLTVAQASPDVEFEGGVQEYRIQAAAAAGLAALRGRQPHRRPQRAARHCDIPRCLLDAGRSRLQVGVVRQRLRDQRRQRGIVERRQPPICHRRRRAIPRLPCRRQDCVRQCLLLQFAAGRRRIERAPRHGGREGRRDHPLAEERCTHQCSFSTR